MARKPVESRVSIKPAMGTNEGPVGTAKAVNVQRLYAYLLMDREKGARFKLAGHETSCCFGANSAV